MPGATLQAEPAFPFTKSAKHRSCCHDNNNNELWRCVLAQTMAVPCINLIHPQTPKL